MDSLAPHHTAVALTLDEPRLHTRRTRLVVLMGLGVMLLAFALMAVSASAAQAYTVSGTVTAQATGFGIAEAAVTVTEPATTGIEVASTITNFAGNYSLEVPAGTYDISFTPPVGSGYTSVEDRGEPVLANRTIDVELAPLSGSVTFSGVLFGEGGVPLPGVAVVLEASGSAPSVARTASDGSFSLTVAPGTYSMTLEDGSLSVGSAAPGNFVFYSQPFAISGNLHEDLTLPVHMLTVRALEANGNPVSGVSVGGGGQGPSTIVEGTGTLGPGIAVSSGEVIESATTGADGTAVFSLPDFTGNQTFEVHPPENTPLVSTTLSITGVNEDETRVIAYPNYARVTSAGTSAGTVELSSPPATTLSAVSDEPIVKGSLPEGAVALVGSVSYTVSGLTPGGSVNVTMQLPPGSEPTNVFKLINGSYVDVTSLATISGNTITLHLTDGGLGDADGIANGVIVDPVVPVRITKHAQTISFSSTAPSSPNVGSVYAVAASATSGLPVSFSINGSSTAGACSVSAGTVSFTGAGTCIIDANQAGNETYLPAPQQQQTVEVVKASQTITFTSAPPGPAIFGGMYSPSATGGASGNPVTFSIDSSSGSGACSISAGTVSFTGVGMCVIDANQAGSANYVPAPEAQQSFSITKASQTITLTSAPPSPALFGGAYTPSATGGASGNPVTFSIDSSSAAGACWILNGKVSFIGPGSCVVDANQAGNANYNAAPKKQQSFSIGFSKTLSGGIGGSLTVSSGQAVYLSPGSTVGGSVTVQAGGALVAQGAKIGSSIYASGATAVRLCASNIGGALSITKTTGLIIAGDNDGVVACAGNKVGGAVGISGNYGGVEFDANAVGGSLAITGNAGTLPPPDSGTVDAVGNKVGGGVQIQS
jgi:large repetitive protein